MVRKAVLPEEEQVRLRRNKEAAKEEAYLRIIDTGIALCMMRIRRLPGR